ncbi:MAG: hypothetical protein DMD25_05405 [Gemmatimonadetes bacterium]|nr:MAG: hypothetical protein DMD25_05405 [Gemmatimonadota bacterium]
MAAAATQLVATACNDSQGPQPDASLLPSLPLPGLATLVVSTSTSGSSLDPDGYTVTVDGGSSQSIGTNGVATFVGLAAGDHTVLLSGVARNCTVSGSNPRTVSLIAGLVGATGFSVSCVAQPTTGNLAVTTNTTGSNLDPDGYTLTVDGGQSKAIGINNTVSISGLSPGDHSVQLNGVAQNCTVSGSNPRTVSITAGSTTTTTFTVSCAATTGNLTVSNSTTGSNLDADGYTVTVSGPVGTTSKTMATNGNVSFANIPPGSYQVTLSGAAANCTVTSANPQTANVPSGGTATTSFTVSCAATTTTGTLTVSNSTTGSNLDADGYTVTVSGSAGTTSKTMATNGNVSFANIPAGSYQVTLSGAAANCTVTSANPQTANVPSGGTATTSFTVSCAATTTTGTLSVTTATTGQSQPTGYTLNVTGPSFPTGASEPIGANATVTATVTAGDYQVSLSGVPSNCTVSGSNPRTVTVPAGGTGPTTFSVSCTGTQPPPTGRVTGRGQVGTAAPQVGNDAVTFDFDLRADLTGRFTGTDYADVHPGGVPATLTTDPVADPATSIIAFRPSSSVCSDPSRGVEVDATGREDTGGIVAYTLAVCDNGPADSGMDFFSVFIPAEGFRRSGQVASGDIVKS